MSIQENTDAQSPFVSLPDDVIILILEKLDLVTQLKMARVHIRFLTLVPRVWRYQCRSTILSPIEMHLNARDIRFFLGSNRKIFQVLRIKLLDRGTFYILTDFIFPNVHDFRFSTHSFRLQDSNMPSIIRSFPNLRTFSPCGFLTGQHMQDFPHLENLTLTFCKNLKVSNLISILETRKLKGLILDLCEDKEFKQTKLPLEAIRHLESLHCDTEEMASWFLEHMEFLTKLKKLLFCGLIDWKVVKSVLNSSHRKSIKCVQLNTSDADIHHLFHNLTVHIQRLQMTHAVIPFNKMPNSTLNFNISQIYIKKSAIATAKYLDKLLKELNTLDILGIEDCILGFRDYTFPVSEIVKNRCTVLNAHLHQNAYLDSVSIGVQKVPILWKVEGEHNFFKLREEALNIKYDTESVGIYFD